MDIFEISKKFPLDEKFALTSQVRRSSRSVCANLAEAYRKRPYPKSFISKLTDCDGEVAETIVHLDFAKDCGYLTASDHEKLCNEYDQIGKLLNTMMNNPAKFGSSIKLLPKKLPINVAN